jgi:hypothetical protein
MNRVKITIKDDDGNLLCKIGTSINKPMKDEYTNNELIEMIEELSAALAAKSNHEKIITSANSWSNKVEPVRQIPKQPRETDILEERGWTQEIESFVHPHCNKVVRTEYWRSPRVLDRRFIYTEGSPIESILSAEAEALANRAFEIILKQFKDAIYLELLNHFKEDALAKETDFFALAHIEDFV